MKTFIRRAVAVVGLSIALGGLGSVPALADGWHDHHWHDGWHGHEWREHHPYWGGGYGYYAPPPVAYAAPPPVVYAPPPVVYAPPPVYAAPGLNVVIPLHIR